MNTTFSESDIVRYTRGDCFILALYMQRKIQDSEYYALVYKNEKIHALIRNSDGYYYDICGKYKNDDHVINYWRYTDNDAEDSSLFQLIRLDESEILKLTCYPVYSKKDHDETKEFVDQNIEKLLNQKSPSPKKEYKDVEHCYDVSEITKSILAGTFDLKMFCFD